MLPAETGQMFAVEVELGLAEEAVLDLSAGLRHVLGARAVPDLAPEMGQALVVGTGWTLAAEMVSALAMGVG